jgi:diguanylate cyclase (GGDEF)-like protein/PAS domain S-box-containing protein
MNHTPIILLADDDPGARLLQTIALEGGGFKVVAAADGEEALIAYDRIKPDCLVLDVVMPKRTGFEVCREVRSRADGKHIPILILTSLDDLDSISTAYVAGATDFSQKGISPLLLVERVRFMLRAKELQDGLIESEARLAQAQAVARIGHWEFDSDGRTVSTSHVALDILGVPITSARSVKAFRHIVHPEDWQRFEGARQHSKVNRTRLSIDFRIITPEGVERVVHMESEPSKPATRYQRSYRVVTVQDITQLRRAEEHVRLLAYFDSLTGLPNRAFLQEQLAFNLKIAVASRLQVAVIALDLEQFNRVNQSLGAAAGDELLRALTQRLKDHFAVTEITDSGATSSIPNSPVLVARTGGDEFGIALTIKPNTGRTAAVLQQLAFRLSVPFIIAGQEIVIGATLGAAVFPDDGDDADALLRCADAALHQAKKISRGSYQFYSAKMQEHATHRLSLESDLRRAIEREQLELHFQPRISARSLKPVGVEALLRWRHPVRGMISPAEFVPIAEDLGLIIELGAWALHNACKHAADLASKGTQLRVAVNVSAIQLQRGVIGEQVRKALSDNQLDPKLLEIEITEGILIDRPELVRRALDEIKQQNIRIALDDFGTGYSSLSYLRTLPIDYLKIDRSFVADLDKSDSSAIVSAILALAKGLNLRTIAEGVETEQQRKALKAAGCDELQGFLFARALPAPELIRWLAAWSHRQASTAANATRPAATK